MSVSRAVFGMALVGATALAACDGALVDDAPQVSVAAYAGPVPRSELALAVTLDGDQVMAYVCGGATTFASETRWFVGQADEGRIALTRDDWKLELTAAGDSAAGTLSGPSGETYTFDVARASAPYGLYRSAAGDGACATGLVMWDEGGAAMTQGVWCDGAGGFGQVTPLAPRPYHDAAGLVAVRRMAFHTAEPQLLVPMPATR